MNIENRTRTAWATSRCSTVKLYSQWGFGNCTLLSSAQLSVFSTTLNPLSARGRNRTSVRGFGDHCSTTILHSLSGHTENRTLIYSLTSYCVSRYTIWPKEEGVGLEPTLAPANAVLPLTLSQPHSPQYESNIHPLFTGEPFYH